MRVIASGYPVFRGAGRAAPTHLGGAFVTRQRSVTFLGVLDVAMPRSNKNTRSTLHSGLEKVPWDYGCPRPHAMLYSMIAEHERRFRHVAQHNERFPANSTYRDSQGDDQLVRRIIKPGT